MSNFINLMISMIFFFGRGGVQNLAKPDDVILERSLMYRHNARSGPSHGGFHDFFAGGGPLIEDMRDYGQNIARFPLNLCHWSFPWKLVQNISSYHPQNALLWDHSNVYFVSNISTLTYLVTFLPHLHTPFF